MTYVEAPPRTTGSAHADKGALAVPAVLENDREALLRTIFDVVVVDEALLFQNLCKLLFQI